MPEREFPPKFRRVSESRPPSWEGIVPLRPVGGSYRPMSTTEVPLHVIPAQVHGSLFAFQVARRTGFRVYLKGEGMGRAQLISRLRIHHKLICNWPTPGTGPL